MKNLYSVATLNLKSCSVIARGSAFILSFLFVSFLPKTIEAQTNYALAFDGSNDYVSIPNGVSATFTLEARIKTTATSNTGTRAWQGDGLFWADINASANDYVFSILNDKLAFDDGNSNTGTFGATLINDGQWHHVAAVRTAGSPGTVRLYVDGVLDGSGTAGSVAINANSTIQIGGDNGHYYNGYMDEIRVWNSARTATQISTYQNSSLAGNETGLYKYMNFNEGVGGNANNLVAGQTDGSLTSMNTAAATSNVSTSGWVFFNCTGVVVAPPTVVSPVNYCLNATPSQLTATGSNLIWGTGGTISGSVGGTGSLTTTTHVEYPYSNQTTNFTTYSPNVKITTVDYYVPAWQSTTNLVLGIYNSSGTKIATSSTITSAPSIGSATKITNTFNYTIATAGNYSIGISSGNGQIGGDSPSYPITESTGTVRVTGHSSYYRCFNNIQFTTTTGSTAPTPSTTAVGTTNYVVTQTVNECVSGQATIAVNVYSSGTWLGTTSTDWNTATNWSCNTIPTSTTNVTIPVQTRLPVINVPVTGTAKNLTIATGASITVNAKLQIAGTITNSGSITATNGTVEMSGVSAQAIPASLFTSNTIKGLIISNAAGVSLAGSLKVTDLVSFGNVNNSVFTTGGFLTLASTLASTAQLGDITNNGNNTGNSVSGAVTVERYVQSRRSYRFLTAPVNSTGAIKANWMENTNNASTGVNNNPAPGYGTHITGSGGSANGFDATVTNNPSLFTFNNLTQVWSAVGNTSSLFKAGAPYRIMVRGDRTTDLNNNLPPSSVTTLRAKGTLLTGKVVLAKTGGGGTAGMPVLNGSINGYSFIANPYAAVVDWKKLVRADVSPTIYYYDPTISGSNGRGAYITYNDLDGVISNVSSAVDNNIQSGQAFFVQTTGANPSITFEEKYKTSSRKAIFRPASELPHLSVRLVLPSQENTNQAADGFAAYFSDNYQSSIADDDSYKFANLDENIGILRNGKTLSIEGRKPVTAADTLPIKMWQLTLSSYTLKIKVANFADNVTAYLDDSYLGSNTVLNNNEETNVHFSIDANPASVAQDRFRIVFESFSTLPVQMTGVKAAEKNKGVLVEWKSESESNIEGYEIERSADANNFTLAGTVKATGNDGTASDYKWYDANPFKGDNYYRIKSVDKSGEIKYSEVVRVQVKKVQDVNSVAASALSGNAIKILFKNMEPGTYTVSVTNTAGQTIYKGTIDHEGGSAGTQITTNDTMPAGIYNLHVNNGTEVYNISVWIK